MMVGQLRNFKRSSIHDYASAASSTLTSLDSSSWSNDNANENSTEDHDKTLEPTNGDDEEKEGNEEEEEEEEEEDEEARVARELALAAAEVSR